MGWKRREKGLLLFASLLALLLALAVTLLLALLVALLLVASLLALLVTLLVTLFVALLFVALFGLGLLAAFLLLLGFLCGHGEGENGSECQHHQVLHKDLCFGE